MRNMKKSALALAMFAAGGVAHAAGEIDILDPNGAGYDIQDFAASKDVDAVGTVTGAVGVEALLASAAQDVDMTNTAANLAGERAIVYSPNTTIGDNSTVTFTVSNGAIKAGLAAGNPVLMGDDGAAGEVIVAQMNDFTTDADGNYLTMRFQVDTASNGDGAGLISTNGYRLAYANGDQVTVVTEAGMSAGQSTTIAVTSAADPSATAISQGTAPAEDVATIVNGLSASVTKVTSTIDVEATPSRASFVDDNGGGDDAVAAGTADTDVNESQATFTMTTGTAEITFDLSDDTYALTLSRANADGVTGAGVDVDGVGDVAMTQSGTDFTYDGGANFADELLAGNNDISIDVDEATTLQTGNWDLSLVLDTDEVGSVTLLNESVSHTWDINGAQVKIPYHAQNASGYNFFMKVVNETSNDANVYADVIAENVSQGTRESLSNVNIGTAVANGATTIGQAAIKTAIQNAGGTMNDADVYHVAMTLTVIAPQNSVQVAAFQKDAVGRTIVPVYVNTNNDNDNRKWQQ